MKSYTDGSHTAFMNAARQHQESIVQQWSKLFGGVCIWDERPNHGVWLKDKYALEGLVFYEDFRKEIMGLYRAGHTKIGMNLLNNALRSEHIPYNLFFPMMKIQNKTATKGFFNELLGRDGVAEILDVKIEYAPQPKCNYLNDGTSFDAFVLYRHKDGSKGAIGIEVKYTEKEYSIGDTEYRNTHDEAGNVKLAEHYEHATRLSGYYILDSEEELVSDNLRQIWRNHILGASMIQHGDIRHFDSVTVFPDGNTHFHTASDEYRGVLTEEGRSSFFAITYEEMFEALTHHFRTPEYLAWIRYLYHRYLFDREMPEVTPAEDNEITESGFLSANITTSYVGKSTAIPVAKTLNRGISRALIDAFRQSPLYELYRQHPDELLVCVRNNYLNVYYHLNSIAEVRLGSNGSINCGIHPYFLGRDGKSNETLYSADIQKLIVNRYEEIKHLVEHKKNNTLEKETQQKLVMQNNASLSSRWFCVDVEWARSFNNQEEKNSGMSSRMDIIAVSKDAPHRVAVIELKYGNKSIDGSAGIVKHIQDFRTLKEGSIHNGTRIDYYGGMCTDICNILEAYEALGCPVPETLRGLTVNQFAASPEFYIVTVDNNAASSRGYIPKQTMAAYLFSPNSKNYIAWRCRKPARHNVQDKYGINVLDASSELPVTFVFSRQNVTNINVTDILEDESHEIIRPAAMNTGGMEQNRKAKGHTVILLCAVLVLIVIIIYLML